LKVFFIENIIEVPITCHKPSWCLVAGVAASLLLQQPMFTLSLVLVGLVAAKWNWTGFSQVLQCVPHSTFHRCSTFIQLSHMLY